MKRSRSRSCDGKVRYDDRSAAWRARNALACDVGARPSRLSAYSCRFCGSWHVGHTPKYRGQR